MRTIRRRQVIDLLGIVAVAAVLTVGVAWRCAALHPWMAYRAEQELSRAEMATLWEVYAAQPMLASTHGRRSRAPGNRTLLLATSSESDDGTAFHVYTCVVNDLGWPRPALRRIVHDTISDQGRSTEYEATFGVDLGRVQLALPWRILWGAFLLDVAVFALLMIATGRVVRRIRRRARLDHGRCPACRYELRLSEPERDADVRCSECGELIDAARLRGPRQVLRPWMFALLAGPAALGLLWFFTGALWTWTRFQVRYAEPLLSRDTVPSLVVALVWVFVLAQGSYRDRPRWQRHVLSTLVVLLLVPIAYASVYILVLRVQMMLRGA